MLKEYEVCQQEKNSSASNYWLTVQIFVGIITAVLGGLAYAFAIQNLNIPGLVLVIVLGLMVIFILKLLYKWLNRVNHLIGVNNLRMREIEVELGMRKNIFIWDLDRWSKLSEDLRRKIAETWYLEEGEDIDKICRSNDIKAIPKRYRPPEVGRNIIKKLLITIGAPWIIVIIVAIILLICEVVN